MIKKPFKDKNLSLLGMGNMRLPVTAEGTIDKEKAFAIIDYAYNHGINYYDTAFRYHGGESELFVGEALSKYPRDTWYVASKFPGHMMKYEDGKLGFQGYLSDFHCDSPAEVFEEQLEKCRVDHFDFYLLHNMAESSFDFYTNEDLGLVAYLQQMQKEGKITHLGFSSHGSPETIDAFLTKYSGVFEFVQIQFNYLDAKLQDAMKKYEIIYEKHGLAVIVMEPVRGGRLADLPPSTVAKLKAVNPTATPASWAFRYFHNLPGVQVVLSGMTTLEQMIENVEIFSTLQPLTPEETAVLDEVVEGMMNDIPCTACRYCAEECPQNLDIPKLIALYNKTRNNSTPPGFKMKAESDAEDPTRCIGCGVCSGVCPQNINVPEIMEELAKKF